MNDLRRLHFKKYAQKFCLEAIIEFCPVTGEKFYVNRIFLEEHSYWHQVPANCFCSECSILLYKEGRKMNKRGNSAFFGKIF